MNLRKKLIKETLKTLDNLEKRIQEKKIQVVNVKVLSQRGEILNV